MTRPGKPRHVQGRQTVRRSCGYSIIPSLTSSGRLQCGQHCFPWLSIVRSFLTSALERRRLEEPRSTELRIPGPVLLREAIQSRHFLFSSDLPFGFVILPGTLIRYGRGGGLWLPFCGRRREVLGLGSSPTRFTREPIRHRHKLPVCPLVAHIPQYPPNRFPGQTDSSEMAFNSTAKSPNKIPLALSGKRSFLARNRLTSALTSATSLLIDEYISIRVCHWICARAS